MARFRVRWISMGLLLSPGVLYSLEPEEAPAKDLATNRSYVEKNREMVQWNGQKTSLAAFKKTCHYLNFLNFRPMDRHTPVFFEARVGVDIKGKRRLTLLRQGEETPLHFVFESATLLPKSKRIVRDDAHIIAYGWTLDDSIPEPTASEGDPDPPPAEPVIRNFYLAGAEASNPVAAAKRRLELRSQFLGELDVVRAVDHWDVAVLAINHSRQKIHDVEVRVVVTDGTDMEGAGLAQVVVEFGTLAPRETAKRTVTIKNPIPSRPFVARVFSHPQKAVVAPD